MNKLDFVTYFIIDFVRLEIGDRLSLWVNCLLDFKSGHNSVW